MVTELLSKPKQSRQLLHLDLNLQPSNMDVTDEDAQMDLDLYFGNFDQKSIIFRRTIPRKTESQPKAYITISLDFMESQKKQ